MNDSIQVDIFVMVISQSGPYRPDSKIKSLIHIFKNVPVGVYLLH